MISNNSKYGWAVVFLLLAATAVDVSGLIISTNLATKSEGHDRFFVVVCRDDIDGLPVIWHNPNGTVLGSKTRPKLEIFNFGTAIVFNSSIRLEDAGNYTCFSQKDKRVFVLFVVPDLKFVDTATNQTGDEGTDFLLKCMVKGGSISWTVEGLMEQNKFEVTEGGLLIRNVTRNDSKTYTCKGYQPTTGKVIDRKIHFHVKHKPTHFKVATGSGSTFLPFHLRSCLCSAIFAEGLRGFVVMSMCLINDLVPVFQSWAAIL